MEKIYRYLDKLGFSNKDFKTLGLILQIYSSLGIFFTIYVLYIIVILGAEIFKVISIFNYGFYGRDLIMSSITIFVLIALAFFVAVFMAGKKAKENYNNISAKETLRKYAIFLLVVNILSIIGFFASISLSALFRIIIEIIVSILYFYFIDRLEELNDPNYMVGEVIEKSNFQEKPNNPFNFEEKLNENVEIIEDEEDKTKDESEIIVNGKVERLDDN